MEKRELIEGYKSNSLSVEQEALLERKIEMGEITLEELGVTELLDKVKAIEVPKASTEMDDRFYAMLKAERSKKPVWDKLRVDFSWTNPFFRFAYGFLLIAMGVFIGQKMIVSNDDSKQVENLTNEIASMKEMMMLQLLEQESTTDRLRAVNLTEELGSVSSKVTGALLKTLTEDENTNVRLAALEALIPYSDQSEVREGLIDAIAHQDSPLVQVALAEVMVALQEKRSKDELKQIIESEETPQEIKDRIEENLKTLI